MKKLLKATELESLGEYEKAKELYEKLDLYFHARRCQTLLWNAARAEREKLNPPPPTRKQLRRKEAQEAVERATKEIDTALEIFGEDLDYSRIAEAVTIRTGLIDLQWRLNPSCYQ